MTLLDDEVKAVKTWVPKHVVLVGVFCIVLLSGVLTVQMVRADGRILPNVTIGGIDVGGLTPVEAKVRLEEALRAINVGGLQFRYRDRSLTVRVNDTTSAPPSQAPITYDIDGMVESAFTFGHNNGPLELITANVQALFSNVKQPAKVSVDEPALKNLLALRFGNLEQPANDASLKITRTLQTLPNDDASATPVTRNVWGIDIKPDSTGVTFDYPGAIAAAVSGLEHWQGAAVELEASTKMPAITTEAAAAAEDRVLKVLDRGDAGLAYDDMTWTVAQKDLANALTLVIRPDGTLGVSLNKDTLVSLLLQASKDVESDPKPTHFSLNEKGRAVDFVGGSLGKRLDRDATVARVDEQFETSPTGLVPVSVTTVSSPDSDPLAEEMGVREMLGYGTSNFAGSPKNRRINIANGAARLNGLIIKPGQEVGLLEYLKPFSAAGGYVPELVIKGNRTVPEYGGGLCQIGTTTFRATMASGLPITQRQNHSYRVVYYEPAGTDATLYDPAPDYRFINDTQSSAILITKIIGDGLRFEMWGTRDGRLQKQSPVKIWNIVSPPPAKLIETSALPDGVKKCFEIAHKGATTNFTYTITYPDGTTKSQDFHSVYKPWQEQCLIGKAGAQRIMKQPDGSLVELPPETPPVTTPVAPKQPVI